MTRHLSRTWSRRAALAACCVAAVAGLAAWGAAHRTPRRAGKSGTRGDAAALVRLAAGFMDRARATGDAAWYARAEEACARALENSPQDYDAMRVHAWVLVGQHRFGQGAEAARRVIAMRPSDPFNYGTLGDALVETGDYEGAANAFQTMIDLRPDTGSYARGAYLRELMGDTAGALELMTMAAGSANPFKPGERAWCLTQIGDLHFSKGDLPAAASSYRAALALAPATAKALHGLARVLAAEGNLEQAVDLYARSIAIIPAPAAVAEHGDLLARLGRPADARRQYDLVAATEKILEASTGAFDREIALFNADHGLRIDRTLAAAEKDLETRKDIYGYDAVAWCAFAAGRIERAREAIGYALKLGTRDARLHYHAGLIALAAQDREQARRHLGTALSINPHFDPRGAEAAARALAALEQEERRSS